MTLLRRLISGCSPYLIVGLLSLIILIPSLIYIEAFSKKSLLEKYQDRVVDIERFDSFIVTALRPNLNGRIYGYPARGSSVPLSTDENGLLPTPSKFKKYKETIVLLGSDEIAGLSPAGSEHTISSELQRLVDSEFGQRFRILNASALGLSSFQLHLFYLNSIRPLRPSIVLQFVGYTDLALLRNGYFKDDFRFPSALFFNELINRHMLPQLTSGFWVTLYTELKHIVGAFKRLLISTSTGTLIFISSMSFIPQGYQWPINFESYFISEKLERAEKSIALIVHQNREAVMQDGRKWFGFMLPTKVELSETELNRELLSQVGVVDLGDTFKDLPTPYLSEFVYSPDGNKALAQSIFNHLKKNGVFATPKRHDND